MGGLCCRERLADSDSEKVSACTRNVMRRMRLRAGSATPGHIDDTEIVRPELADGEGRAPQIKLSTRRTGDASATSA